MSKSDFFLVEFCGESGGFPEFISGEYNVDEWEWDEFDPNAAGVDIEQKYEFYIKEKNKKISTLDFLGFPHNIVSDDFIKICDELGVRYLSVSVTLSRAGENKFHKKYSIFTPLEGVKLLDMERSSYSLDKNMETGEVIYNRYYPSVPVYSYIKSFFTNKDESSAFFMCIELMKWVCNGDFKKRADKDLVGFSFIPITPDFSFDPWGEMP